MPFPGYAGEEGLALPTIINTGFRSPVANRERLKWSVGWLRSCLAVARLTGPSVRGSKMRRTTVRVMDAGTRKSIEVLRNDLKRDRNKFFAAALGLRFVWQPKTHPLPQMLWDRQVVAGGCFLSWLPAGDWLCGIVGPTQDGKDFCHYDVFFDGDNAEACSKFKQHACEADEFWRRDAAQLLEDDVHRIGCEYLILLLFERNLSAGKLLWNENEQPGHPETKSRIACLKDVYSETERFLSELLESFDSTVPISEEPVDQQDKARDELDRYVEGLTMRTKNVPSWVIELRVEVAKLVGLPKNRERFLEMIREWKRPEIQRRAVRDADAVGPPAPRVRCPLPVGDKNLSLPEKYVVLTMIHDALIEESGRIKPQAASADDLADPYDAMAFVAFRDEDALLEKLPDNSQAALSAALEDIKVDLGQVPQTAVNGPMDQGQNGTSAEPKKLLFGWPSILDALNQRNDKSSRDRVSRLNKSSDGPIKQGTQGKQPVVDRDRLIPWWSGLEARHANSVQRETDKEATVSKSYEHGRDGEVVPDIAGHVLKRRGKR